MKKLQFILIAWLLLICAPVLAGVNINTANEEQLASELTNIGASKAAAIIKYRQDNGPFENIDDLANVRGVGVATIKKNRHLIRLEGVEVDSVNQMEGSELPLKMIKKPCKEDKASDL